MNIDAFKSYYSDGKNKLEEKINRFNDELVKEDNKFLRENLEYFKNLNSNGKLVRGTLVNLGYNLLLEENGFNLSGGERQRIILARTLLCDFDILIIDEGLNQVDIILERKILKNVFEYFY